MSKRKERERERGVREGSEKGGEREWGEGLLGFILISKTKTLSSNFKLGFIFERLYIHLLNISSYLIYKVNPKIYSLHPILILYFPSVPFLNFKVLK